MPERSRRAFLKLLAAAPVAGVIAATVGAEAQPEPAAEPVWMTTTDPNTGELQLQLLQGVQGDWRYADDALVVHMPPGPPITEEQVNAALRQAMSRSGQAPRRARGWRLSGPIGQSTPPTLRGSLTLVMEERPDA